MIYRRSAFDISGDIAGFDRGSFDWDLTDGYVLKFYNPSGIKVAEITGNISDNTLLNLSFSFLQDGGCERFSFTLAEPYKTVTISSNYRMEIYLFNQQEVPWFTGYLETIPQEGTEKKQTYTGYGYYGKFANKLVTMIKTGTEVSEIAEEDVLDDEIIPNYDILKNSDKIEEVYTLKGTFQTEREYARDIIKRLAEIAQNYEFGVDREREFYFRTIDTSIKEKLWIGRDVDTFTPKSDPKDLVNRWHIYSPPFSDGRNFQKIYPDADSIRDNSLSEKPYEVPQIVNLYSTTDLASGRTPTTNPVAGVPANMTDGDTTTLWESGAAQTIGHYIQIDLGTVYDDIAKIVLDQSDITAQDYYARGFRIRISTDGTSWTDVWTKANDPGYAPIVTFSPVRARYIRIELTEAHANEWKAGEFEVYELDTRDLDRWAEAKLNDSKDPKESATITIRGADSLLTKYPLVRPILPHGKIQITTLDNKTYSYQKKSCNYIITPSEFTINIQGGDIEKKPSEKILDLRRQLAETRLLGIRRANNIAGSVGIKQAAFTVNQLSVTDLADIANLLTVAAGRIRIGSSVLGADLHGIEIIDNQAVPVTRVKAGHLAAGIANYGIDTFDENGVKTIDLCDLQLVWKEVYDNILTANATSVTIAGLDGDTDHIYHVFVRFVGNAVTNFFIRLNNDAGNNYLRQYISADDAVVASNEFGPTTAMWIGGSAGVGQCCMTWAQLYARAGFPRTLLHLCLTDLTAAEPGVWYSVHNLWSNTLANVTSIVILAANANGLGIGTHISVYKIPSY